MMVQMYSWWRDAGLGSDDESICRLRLKSWRWWAFFASTKALVLLYYYLNYRDFTISAWFVHSSWQLTCFCCSERGYGGLGRWSTGIIQLLWLIWLEIVKCQASLSTKAFYCRAFIICFIGRVVVEFWRQYFSLTMSSVCFEYLNADMLYPFWPLQANSSLSVWLLIPCVCLPI